MTLILLFGTWRIPVGMGRYSTSFSVNHDDSILLVGKLGFSCFCHHFTPQYLVEEEEELKQRAIWLTVWDQDRVGTNKFLGELCIPLSSFDFGKSAPSWYKLQDYAETGILPSTPMPSSSKPPVGGATTPLRAAMESEPQKLLEEEEVPASLETKKSTEE